MSRECALWERPRKTQVVVKKKLARLLKPPPPPPVVPSVAFVSQAPRIAPNPPSFAFPDSMLAADITAHPHELRRQQKLAREKIAHWMHHEGRAQSDPAIVRMTTEIARLDNMLQNPTKDRSHVDPRGAIKPPPPSKFNLGKSIQVAEPHRPLAAFTAPPRPPPYDPIPDPRPVSYFEPETEQLRTFGGPTYVPQLERFVVDQSMTPTAGAVHRYPGTLPAFSGVDKYYRFKECVVDRYRPMAPTLSRTRVSSAGAKKCTWLFFGL
jgi:hypothetical protein